MNPSSGLRWRRFALASLASFASIVAAGAVTSAPAAKQTLFNDVHLHLTNYIQEGPSVQELLQTMGSQVGRAALFGIPLQQQWSFRVSGDHAPAYYLDTDAHLYYYSFTDALTARAYLSLPEEQRARFEPMITGFNPTDMYAADHIRRVLQTFPGVFSGIGEFTIHKEFVSSKVAGDVASLTDPALDRIFSLAGEVGLVVLLHNDLDAPFAKASAPPAHFEQLLALFRRHPETTIIWAHAGVGRVVHPVDRHLALLESILDDPGLRHVHVDLSWSEAAKYVVDSPEATRRAAALLNRHPDRFLFGTDEVGPRTPSDHQRVYRLYAPLLKRLSPEAKDKFLKANFARLFDGARGRVRAWERSHVSSAQ